ncbi:tol-pal system YbgF family protein [Novosphingobium sp. KA1]|uniref:tetratricopeptide repeat protein n=1 Tax=Novosphingobium sp. (strain KA1) TaxID=164608 RepID=UPI00351C5ECD
MFSSLGSQRAAKALSLITVRRMRLAATGTVALALVGLSLPAQAQDAGTDARLKKVESEVRALQRKVFPGGDGKYFAPEITGPAAVPTPALGQPATSPVSDVLVRMDALETQMRSLTAQVEQNTNRINQLEAKLAASVPPPMDSAMAAPSASSSNLSAMNAPATTPAATPASGPASGQPTLKPAAQVRPAAPSDSRIDAVKAVVKPQTADAADDEYSYGFRLWEAKFYPEAQQQLKLYLEKYPRHARVSWGRNLLGRAYLDDGKPLEAAKWFVQNYQADKRGDRAPDSLLYLAVSMKQIKDTKRACIVLAEFSETYASEAAGRLKGLYDSTRNGLTCS